MNPYSILPKGTQDKPAQMTVSSCELRVEDMISSGIYHAFVGIENSVTKITRLLTRH